MGNGNGAAAPVQVIPFHGAARESQEPFADVSLTPGASVQSVLQGAAQSIPADGYLRAVWIEVECSGGATGTAASIDYPWNLIDSVTLHDVNGNPLFGPLTGYQLYLANFLGGYNFNGKLDSWYGYSADTANPSFALRVPVEINRQTGFGALANQSSSANYKLRINLAPESAVWSAITTPPEVRFRISMEVWKQPNATDVMGRPQQIHPPAHGTTQYWSVSQFTINGGNQNIEITRVGNVIRQWILVYRDASGDRLADSNMPDPLQINWDARAFTNETRRQYKNRMIEGYITQTAPQGVASFSFDRTGLGHVGGGSAVMYLPTVQATRMQISGDWNSAGILEVLTNDIAPYEATPQLKYSEGSATGFNPQVGSPVPGGGA